jgi:ribosomal protein S18 acetylase RimI-like enzyme
MTILVRAASEADIDTLGELNGFVQGLHARLYPNDFKQTLGANDLRAFFAARLGAIAVAESDSATVGYVWCEAQNLPETPFTPAKPRVYVHHLSVAPSARRRGVGAALMRHVLQWAEAQGLQEITLGVWAANRDALRFFKAQGFVPTTATLRKGLDGPGRPENRPQRRRIKV